MISYLNDSQIREKSREELVQLYEQVEEYRTSDEFPPIKASKLRNYSDKLFARIMELNQHPLGLEMRYEPLEDAG